MSNTQVDEELDKIVNDAFHQIHTRALRDAPVYLPHVSIAKDTLKAALRDRESHKGTEDDYIKELEKLVIFMCDVYSKFQDSVAVQTNDSGQTDDKWMDVYMSIPTIQGTMNRIYTSRIGNLRTQLLNREAPSMSLEQLFEKLKVGRREKGAPDDQA